MSSCELCGKIEEDLLNALVEGVNFKVCSNCSRFGKVVQSNTIKKNNIKMIRRESIIEDVSSDYAEKIKNAREKKNISQKDLATKINEREGLISKIEQGSLKPNLELAKKLERELHLNLIVQEKILEAPSLKIESKEFTIGHFIKK